ncbi:MBL fold metallo-hydrolase [Massilia sp. PAMC28688]|uniref:MBL fold metallo-hydrolase n=1 Tax=Massilia sp. PAMC28688 TaxID=2861283 RepID=UPI001C624F88|nr:MBL fold metallo-hydrolase [Massilia sp. PAMC28688]QYF94140.1 MBL fold metallo-hydrolase [Massilia sp. PAMC28688]
MQITQLRNATIIVHTRHHHVLVDPMLAPRGALPPLRVFDGKRQRNPLVDLPEGTEALLDQVTHCLITHCQKGHFDHLDRAGKRFLRERQIPIICSAHDARYLRSRGLNVQPLPAGAGPHPFLGGSIETVVCTHGRGLVGALMEHGVGFFLDLPGEPTLYISGDTVLTEQVRSVVIARQPAICVVPAGGARFDLGGEIIMGPPDVIALARLARGTVMANHLEALSHCAPTRAQVLALAQANALGGRILAPADGQTLHFNTVEACHAA